MEKTYDFVFASMCTWCRKRMFYPNKNLDNYNKTATQINDNNGCGVCFGILSQYTSEAFANEVKLVEQACQIEHDDFRFALVTPYYSTIRERLVEILLDERPDSMLTMTIIRRHYFNVKDEWKRLMVERLENTLGIPYRTSSPFEIKITFNRTDDLSEDLLLMQKFGLKIREKKKNDPSLKQEFTKQDVVSALSTARSAHLKEIYDLPLKFLSSKYEITCTHEPVFLAGRYLKYSRRLPQTKWIVEGVKKTETSIEEIFNDFFADVFQTSEMIKMIAAGREDVDVRCLGSGRPFCLEIPLPKRTKFTQQEITVLQNEMNAKYGDLIQIVDLQTINKEQLKFIKMGESSKSKCYKATCKEI
jgi:tRNA pseudouridine synthase 10